MRPSLPSRIQVQARLYGPSTRAPTAARQVADAVDGFVVAARWLGHQQLTVDIDMCVDGLDRLAGALAAANLHVGAHAIGPPPSGAWPEADLLCQLAIQVIDDGPDRPREVPP